MPSSSLFRERSFGKLSLYGVYYDLTKLADEQTPSVHFS